MGWIVSGARVLASAERASHPSSRRKGLLGRTSFSGALVIEPCNWVHTIGMKFAIDVAFVDRNGTVIKTQRMRRNRLGMPVIGAAYVVEAESGAFSRWGLHVGDELEFRGQQPDTSESQ
ncbi:MAG: DUF192 domain-containing protein [Ilumatobacteraceae bacterium]